MVEDILFRIEYQNIGLLLDERKNKMTSEQLANRIKLKVWNMAYKAKASHMGGNFSVADAIAVLYHDIAKVDPQNPKDENRDRIILSKGHCCAVMYAVLAEYGFFNEKDLDTFGENGSIFSCHISCKVPGVEFSSGSLGHGAAVAAGIALNGKIKNKDYKVFAIVGDGECNEGSIWEMIMFAGHNKLSNFTVIVDSNKMQAMGETNDIVNLDPMSEKWRSFGWYAIDVDGHNHNELRNAFNECTNGKPKVIISHTIKGHGISFMENNLWWHYQIPFGDYYEKAVKELEDEFRRL